MTQAEVTSSDNVSFWESRYQENDMPWDLGEAAPPFASLLASARENLNPGKLAVLGSGAGHDAALFARAGFEVTGFDYAPGAVQRATDLYGDLVRFEQADIFNLPATYAGTFDYVLEHTCFCAILPERRQDYVQSVLTLLKPSGRLIALFWAHNEEGGPPFKTDDTELTALFSPYFDFESLTIPEDSIERRKGQERLAILRRKV